MAPKQSRAFMFTLNNPTPATDALIRGWFESGDVVYVTWQKEKAPSTGTLHMQGYVITKANEKSKAGFSLKWCKDNLSPKAHWEVRMGSHKQAEDYCRKKDSRVDGPWRLGEWKDQEDTRAEAGERIKKVTLLDVKASIDKGMTDKMLWEQHFGSMTRYSAAFDRYKLITQVGERKQPYVFFFWGPPGTGKSRRALEIADKNGGAFWYNAAGDKAWFDGYNPAQHKVIVLDDFKGNLPYTMLLRMLDRYPMQVEIKGGTVAFNPDIIIITSNTPANQWYFQDNINFDHGALLRRLQHPYGMTMEYKASTNPTVEEPLDMPALEDIYDDIVEGKLFKQFEEAVAAPTIDLTADDFVDDDEEAIARAEQASLARGETHSDENYDEDAYDFGDDPDLGEGAQPGGAVSITSDLDRDFDESPKFVSARTLRRTDEDSLVFNKPLNKAGMFKKVGPEPVQSILSFKRPTTQDNKKRRIMVSMKDNNDDDDG